MHHATPDDPWANEWLKDNVASSGAYIVETFKPGEQVVLKRNERGRTASIGKLPFFKRVVIQTVPEAATRANLVERGDADISIDLAASDVIALQERGKVKVVSNPQINAFTYIAFNTQKPPFDNLKLREAIAAALPYKDMLAAAIYGRGAPLFGAGWTGTPPTQDFPQALPHPDRSRRRQEAHGGSSGGAVQDLDLLQHRQRRCRRALSALVEGSAGTASASISRSASCPTRRWRRSRPTRRYDLITETTSAMLPSTDYFFRIFFQGTVALEPRQLD